MSNNFKNELKLTCKYNFEEYNDFVQIDKRRELIISLIIISIIFFTILFYLGYSSGGIYGVVGLFKIVIPIYILVLLIRITFRNGITSVRMKIEFDANKLGENEHHFIFNEEGVLLESENFNKLYSWYDIYKAIESNKSFFLFTTQHITLLLPKRIFQKEEVVEFKDLVLSKINNKKVNFKNKS